MAFFFSKASQLTTFPSVCTKVIVHWLFDFVKVPVAALIGLLTCVFLVEYDVFY